MRPHHHLLRKIGQHDLDPKVPYVSGKNGELVPKSKRPETKDSEVHDHVHVRHNKTEEEVVPVEDSVKEEVIPDEVEIAPVASEEVGTEASQEPVKKRVPPPRRKKAPVPSDG